jgi:hypothetical protein
VACISSITFWELDVIFFSWRNNLLSNCIGCLCKSDKLQSRALDYFGDDQMLMLFCHSELPTGLVYSSLGLSEDIDGSDNLVAISEQLFALMLN